MGNFLTKVENDTEYRSFISDAIRPSVAYCEEEKHVHYDSLPVVTCVYNIDNSNVGTAVWLTHDNGYASNSFSKMVVDGVIQKTWDGGQEVDAVYDTFTFYSPGTHVVEWTLTDSSRINYEVFSITARNLSGNLVYVDIPSTVTYIDFGALTSAPSVMLNSAYPPSFNGNVFNNNATVYIPMKYRQNYLDYWGYSNIPVVGIY